MKKIGLAIFIISFGFFVALLSLGEYKLTDKIVKDSVGDKSSSITATKAYQDIKGKSFTNQFKFVSKIENLFKEANEKIIETEGVTDEDISNLIYHSTQNNIIKFSKESIKLAFDEGNATVESKAKLVAENLGWLFEKDDVESKEKLSDILNGKKADINASLIRNKGFDESKFGSYLLPITKKSTTGFIANNKWLLFMLSLFMACIGVLINVLPGLKKYAGIKNDGVYHNPATNRGWIGIIVGSFLIGFYILLYWFPYYITPWIVMVEPIKNIFNDGEASQWFLYGVLYTLAMIVMGVRMIIKYRHNKYQIIRTLSVLFFQIAFAFMIPEILEALNKPYVDFKNMWPLDYKFFFDIKGTLEQGTFGLFMLIWGIALFIIGVPIFVYFFGKRWYCSWVCGCGGLAETLGDPYRQLSDKSLKAWKIERWLIHGVLVFVVVMTLLVLYTFFTGSYSVLGIQTETVKTIYGFLIGSVFAGVIGTGFYPLMGNRTWCRFGCPLAAYLGLVQKFKSRFRITTNGGQCISCGNCSTYCEMGIDVRAYAQKGQNIVRSSCVGCGVCSAVCPRGVLKLENGPEENRVSDLPIILGNDGIVKLNENME